MGTRWASFAALLLVPSVVACNGRSPYADRAEQSNVPSSVFLVVDTSGSMAEPTVGNEAKIESAIRASSTLARSLQPEADIGIWSYPSATAIDLCTSGDLVLDLGSHSLSELSSSINGLLPYGDTPTAEALAAVRSEISGSAEAVTVVLVSDGMYTCGDPCPVAIAMAEDQGVEFVVVGFDVDPDATASLRCIAQSTGGRYFEATDGAALESLFADASVLFEVSDV